MHREYFFYVRKNDVYPFVYIDVNTYVWTLGLQLDLEFKEFVIGFLCFGLSINWS